MNISFDCSEVIAEVNQRCTLEGRQPTAEEYILVFDCLRLANTQLQQANAESQQANADLQQANAELQQANIQLQQANVELQQTNNRLSHDREISQRLFHTEHLEVGRDNIRLHSLVKWFLYVVLITSPNSLPPDLFQTFMISISSLTPSFQFLDE